MQSSTLPISCYIRTLNEARMVGAVIEAARQIAAEVIVVDCGSTDGTIDIAEKAGARVIYQAWLGNGKQKRFAEDQCAHDWLLDLDADEIVTPDFAARCATCSKRGAPPHAIYETMMVTAPPIGEPWWKHALADRRKLYDRRRIRQPEHDAWDQFETPPGMQIGRIKAPLLHYSYRDYEHFEHKLNHWSGVAARATKLKPLWLLRLRILFASPFYFFKQYLGRGHWRGGMTGIVIAGLSAHGRWLKDVKMLEIHMRRRHDAKSAKDQ